MGKNGDMFIKLSLIGISFEYVAEQIVNETTENFMNFESLAKFQYMDHMGRDQGYKCTY